MKTFKVGDKVRRLTKEQDKDWNHYLGDKRGDVLTVSSLEGTNFYLKEDTSGFSWYSKYFELAEDYNIDDDLIKASKLLNKKVYYKLAGKVHSDVVTCVSLIDRENVELYEYSWSVKDALRDNDKAVVLDFKDDRNIPFSCVVDKPSVTIKLNDSYDAEVFPDKVVVGCQTIPFSVIEEIVKINKK